MAMQTLEDAFVHELKDLMSAEKQITKALPKMAKKAHDKELKQCLQQHLEETEDQIELLEKTFETLGKKPKAEMCEGMKGLLEEGAQVLEEESDPHVSDAMIIGAAQKVEHYEIAGYGTVCTWAETLGLDDAKDLLGSILEQEKKADEKLTAIASRLNKEAQSTGQGA